MAPSLRVWTRTGGEIAVEHAAQSGLVIALVAARRGQRYGLVRSAEGESIFCGCFDAAGLPDIAEISLDIPHEQIALSLRDGRRMVRRVADAFRCW